MGGNEAAAHALEERLLRMPLDGRPPDLAIDGFRRAFRAAVWATHRMSRRPTGYAPEFLEQDGWWNPGIERLVSYVGSVEESPFLYDPERPAAEQRNRVRILDARTGERVPASARRVLATAGLSGLHQIRVVVCDGPELLGWFGGFREEPFTRDDTALFQRMVPALRTALLWRRRLLRADEVVAGFEAAMEALACPAFVIRGGRTIEHANACGRALVELRGSRALARELVESARLGQAERIALTGAGVSRLELFVVRGRTARSEVNIARATDRWKLTRRQREVLALIASGDTNKSIATKLGCAEVTVELHVTALLRKSGAATRTELVSRLLSGNDGW